jgi:small-conductance mechanosensitive channel
MMPPPFNDRPPDSNSGPIVIFCFSVMGAALALLCTYALFGPALFILAFLFAGVAALHYWLWGRSLSEASSSDSSATSDS